MKSFLVAVKDDRGRPEVVRNVLTERFKDCYAFVEGRVWLVAAERPTTTAADITRMFTGVDPHPYLSAAAEPRDAASVSEATEPRESYLPLLFVVKVQEYRLTELERRMTALEAGMKSINDTVVEINTKMDGLASKTYVLTIFGMTGGLAVLTFIGHVLIRTLGST